MHLHHIKNKTVKYLGWVMNQAKDAAHNFQALQQKVIDMRAEQLSFDGLQLDKDPSTNSEDSKISEAYGLMKVTTLIVEHRLADSDVQTHVYCVNGCSHMLLAVTPWVTMYAMLR